MAVQKGQYYSLSYKGSALGKLMNISLSIDGEQIDISNFDSGQFAEFLQGRTSWTISFTARLEQTDTAGQLTVADDLLAGNNGEWVFGPATTTTGDLTFTGDGNPQNITIDAADESAIEISGEIQGTSTLTKAVAV